MSTPQLLDIASFQYRAREYVRAKNWRGPDVDDVVSEMVIEALEHPDKMLSLNYVYLHAVDKINPPVRQKNVRVGRRSHQTVSLDAPLPHTDDAQTLQDTALIRHPRGDADPLADVLATVPPSGRERAMLLLWQLYGYSLKEIGFLFGVTESRVSQILTALREEETADAPQWEGWEWLTL